MSDTPRTDAAAFHTSTNGGLLTASVVTVDVAIKLERELNAAKADLIAAQGYRAAAEEIAARRGEMVDALIAERDEARRSACMVKARYLESIDGFPRPTDDEIGIKARAIARGMRWDCFEKEAKP